MLSIRRSEVSKQAEVLIKWRGLPEFESTWEPIKVITEQYPEFQLEDKLSLLRRGIDKLAVSLAFVQKKSRSQKKKSD